MKQLDRSNILERVNGVEWRNHPNCTYYRQLLSVKGGEVFTCPTAKVSHSESTDHIVGKAQT